MLVISEMLTLMQLQESPVILGVSPKTPSGYLTPQIIMDSIMP